MARRMKMAMVALVGALTAEGAAAQAGGASAQQAKARMHQCFTDAARDLDDQVSDARTIAGAALASCRQEELASAAFVLRERPGSGWTPDQLLQNSRTQQTDAVTAIVLKQRAARRRAP